MWTAGFTLGSRAGHRQARRGPEAPIKASLPWLRGIPTPGESSLFLSFSLMLVMLAQRFLRHTHSVLGVFSPPEGFLRSEFTLCTGQVSGLKLWSRPAADGCCTLCVCAQVYTCGCEVGKCMCYVCACVHRCASVCMCVHVCTCMCGRESSLPAHLLPGWDSPWPQRPGFPTGSCALMPASWFPRLLCISCFCPSFLFLFLLPCFPSFLPFFFF